MSLLKEIQDDAVSSGKDLALILRKCKVLAFQLDNAPLEAWIQHESNGYPEGADLPDYRIFEMDLKGHFSGPFGASIRNAPIPPLVLDKKLRHLSQYKCYQSLQAIEHSLQENHTEFIIPMDNLAAYLGGKLYNGFGCMQAWGEIPRLNLVEVLNVVRNRILDFVLALAKENPQLLKQELSEGMLEPKRVTQIFNTTVYGGSANIVGAAHSSNLAFNVNPNDLVSMRQALMDQGVEPEDIQILEHALDAEPRPEKSGQYGEKIAEWVGGMMKKAASGAWNIGTEVAAKVLTKALNQYFGLDS